ncbi:protein-L-isoaspartate O-methyltransferase [Parapedobacter defluvii]|uniref:Protein-L-isoaspartate O-methyltransferase n=1 Tax=Parapedobacter defluvii TaxID=2045106 RepID=A0ABQ1LLX7_9SPHI|nr:protein-L-isoaspartate(D-aspartate) O-methyltransferase [Parapedobacter defluvii]RQP19099.1 MAG: protein-L-isoaspartate(D-aspartate) O-methyltransferase [Parapedobacter sp.]GGC26528.1 protein-L-isoaspartate O-methyltransferase [Parapedobacter defluvii]
MKLLVLIGLIIAVETHQFLVQDEQSLRNDMVRQQLEARGINHDATLDAMRKVQRHLFVPPQYRAQAYADSPLSIGHGQTISQPYIVAYMTQLLDLKPNHRVLEIGTGSGYQAAVLAEMVNEVYTIEIVKELGQQAEKLLDSLGYANVTVIIGDGYKGLETKAPFDAIVVTAAPDEIPPPLIKQLKDGGKMVIPVGPPAAVQTLILMEKQNGKVVETKLTPVRFVPFTRSQ